MNGDCRFFLSSCPQGNPRNQGCYLIYIAPPSVPSRLFAFLWINYKNIKYDILCWWNLQHLLTILVESHLLLFVFAYWLYSNEFIFYFFRCMVFYQASIHKQLHLLHNNQLEKNDLDGTLLMEPYNQVYH